MRLKAHDVVERARRIVLAKLHDGMGTCARLRILQPHGLQRAEKQGSFSARGHDLDGHTALEENGLFKTVHLRRLRRRQRLPKGSVLRLRHRAVDVGGVALAVARGAVCLRHVDGFERHDGRRRIIEVEGSVAHHLAQAGGKRPVRQRPRRHDGHGLRLAGNFLDALAHDLDARVRRQLLRDVARESLAVDGKRTARRHAHSIRRRHDERAETAHLLLEDADGVLKTRAAQRIAADKLGEVRRLVRRGRCDGAHLVEQDLDAALCSLPGGLAAGEPRAHDDDLLHFDASASAAFFAAAAASFAFFASRRARLFSISLLIGWSTRVLHASLLQ